MRELKAHLVEGDLPQNQLKIEVFDDPGPGGAHHLYEISWPLDGEIQRTEFVRFQKGPIKEVGINGITNETLLAIVIDRLACFQDGPFKCIENEDALRYCNYALMSLKQRTLDRLRRNIEGTMQK